MFLFIFISFSTHFIQKKRKRKKKLQTKEKGEKREHEHENARNYNNNRRFDGSVWQLNDVEVKYNNKNEGRDEGSKNVIFLMFFVQIIIIKEKIKQHSPFLFITSKRKIRLLYSFVLCPSTRRSCCILVQRATYACEYGMV